jgi:hypothetical protein
MIFAAIGVRCIRENADFGGLLASSAQVMGLLRLGPFSLTACRFRVSLSFLPLSRSPGARRPRLRVVERAVQNISIKALKNAKNLLKL